MTRPKSEDSLTHKTGVFVFSRILSTLVELGTVILLVRLLSKDAMAIIGFLLLVYQTARSLATFGFPESVFYFFEKVDPRCRRALALRTVGTLAVLGALTALALLGLAAAAPHVLRNWGPAHVELLQQLLPWLALAALLEIPTWPMSNILLALDRQKGASWYQILTSGASFVALVGPVLLGFEIAVAVYGLAFYAVARFVLSVIWFQVVLPGPGARLPPGSYGEQVRFSVPLGLNTLSARINKYIDKFVVSILLPAAAFAEYQVGGQELPLITAIPMAVGSVFISRYVSYQLAGERDALLDLWRRGIEGVSLIVVPASALFIAVAHDFVTLVFGAQYAPAVLPFQIYTVILLHRVAQYSSVLQAYADTRSILRITLTILVFNLILSVPLTMSLGLPGPALATMISALTGWYLYLRRIGHHLQVGLGEAFPWGFYLRVMTLAAVAGVVTWVMRFTALQALPQVAALAASVGIFVALYAGLGTLTRVIGRDHWRVFRDWLLLRFLWR